jgi:hypothetical protein
MNQLKVSLILLPLLCTGMLRAGPALFVSAEPGNDLVRVLGDAGYDCMRADHPAAAVAQAPAGGAVMILATGYPATATAVDAALFTAAAAKNLRLYVEYPSSLPGLTVGARVTPTYDRAVVRSEFFGANLAPLRILAIHGLTYLPVNAANAHMVSARVAGFDTAVFGLDNTPTAPLLFEMPGAPVMVATTKLSQFVTARYAPQDAWQAVWSGIMNWLLPGQELPDLTWTPTVRTTYGPDDELPADVERQAILRGTEWFHRSKLLLHPDRVAEVNAAMAANSISPRAPTPPPDAPVGDGSLGILEAPLSEIFPDGSQIQSVIRRGDCHAEAAMAMALGAQLGAPAENQNIARNLLDFYLFESEARKGGRGDPNHGAYGLIAWGIQSGAWLTANYGDDNARLLMGTAATAAVLDDGRWDEAMMMCLLGNLRTAGQLGFRSDRIDMPELGSQGWRPFFERWNTSYSPHMESWLWACYLWAYQRTGFELFYERAATALRMTMAQYPNGLRWTNGLAQERARILLPLAWLVRVRDTPEHRAWLQTAVDGLLSLQQENGAIREELGPPGQGMFPQPSSNAAYGTGEAPLIQQNGDPVADMLYTTNFAFLALREAAEATGDPAIRAAEDKLAKFLCRIQIRSESQPSLDGGWFRVFDYNRWEAWGSNADHGWGAWAIESGWTQGWIVAVLAMRQMETSLWDMLDRPGIESTFATLRPQMLPDEAITGATGGAIQHDAIGAVIELGTPIDPRYPGAGAAGLLDGRRGPDGYQAPAWLGFEGVDQVATIDLGETKQITRLGLSALQTTLLGIYLPARAEFSVSSDGTNFTPVAVVTPQRQPQTTGVAREMMLSEAIAGVQARHVRARIVSLGTIPAGLHAAGSRAWMFLDEIVVNPELPPPDEPPPPDGPAGAYRRAVLDRGPVFYWTFDEESGPAADLMSAQSGNQLTPQGGAGRIPSGLGLGMAADFNGATGSRFFSNSLAAARTSYDHYAVEFWVRLGDATGSAYLLEGFDGGTLGNSPALIHGFNPNLEGFFAAGGRTGNTGPATLADMAWHHVVFEVNVPANTHSLYIDGVAAGSFPGSRPWRLPVLGVGSPAVNATQPMTGQLDELAIYDLTAAAFTALDLAAHHAVLTAAGPARLVLQRYDPATSEIGLSVAPIPPGRMFHLRGSTDLRVFLPFEPPVEFDINTPQPLLVRTYGEPRFFVQAYEGASP